MAKALKFVTASIAVAAGLAGLGGAARADNFIITYSGQGTSGTAYVTGNAIGGGEYQLTSGTLNSSTLGTETLVAPGSGVFSNTNGDNLPYDNLLFFPANSSASPDGANLTYAGGIVFQTSSASKQDVYFSANNQGSNDPTIFYFSGFDRPNGALDSFTVSAAPVVSAAPEPAVWMTLLMGVGMIGAGLRAKRRKFKSALSAA